MRVEWISRWKMTISSEPVLPGVWKKKEGGHVVRGKALDPRTGTMKEIRRVLDEPDPKKALAWLTLEREKVKRGISGSEESRTIPTWKDFAASLFEAKVDDGTIASAKGREKYANTLKRLSKAKWAPWFLDQIKHADLLDWRATLPKLVWERRNKKGDVIKKGTYSANTLNDWLNIARVVFAAATIKYDLPRDPMLGIEDFEVTHDTYTEEEPNSLTDAEVSTWLTKFKEMFPQFFAMVFVGLIHGMRPSALRPLRRKGATPDYVPDKRRLLIRQSQTIGKEVWNRTKTKQPVTLTLDPRVITVLKWHVDTQLVTDKQKASDLLFPNEKGGFRSRSCLDKPFAAVTKACKLGKHITPRAMRRTFQDLARAGKIPGVVAKAISGHKTDAMLLRYSTATETEVTQALGKIVDIAMARNARKGARRKAS